MGASVSVSTCAKDVEGSVSEEAVYVESVAVYVL